MKKVMLLGVAIMLTASIVKAQQITAGGGLAYGTDISQAAIFLNGQYFFSEKLAAAPSLIFYFPEKNTFSYPGYTSETKSSLWEFNADVNYYFFGPDVVKLFGEGGLNISTVKATSKVSGSGVSQKQSASDTKLGLNLGIGSDFKVSDKIIPFFAIKYTVSDFDQLVLKGGVRFVIK